MNFNLLIIIILVDYLAHVHNWLWHYYVTRFAIQLRLMLNNNCYNGSNIVILLVNDIQQILINYWRIVEIKPKLE